MPREYQTVQEVIGPLMLVRTSGGIAYDEQVKVELSDGTCSLGTVLEVSEDTALVQVFHGTAGADPAATKLRFLGRGLELGLSPDLLGRSFDGLGRPRDGGPELLAEKYRSIHGEAMNPAARDFPDDFIQTGISSIDGCNPLVRGQKLPIFSEAGLPHNELAAQIARQAGVLADADAASSEDGKAEGGGSEEEAAEESAVGDGKTGGSSFAVVFAGIGITFEDADFFMREFQANGAIERSVLFLNLADDPVTERFATPRMALTAAEYLAFECDLHVLVILTDMTYYCEALREISAARKEVPGRRGYPGYLYTDLATLYERAGRVEGKRGSITQIPILTMPDGDKTHPIPDLTGYITEGQILLDRTLHRSGIYPPVNVLPSLSRLKQKGIGAGKTREDHAEVSDQLFGAYASGIGARELAVVLGESALTSTDRAYVRFAEAFEREFVAQNAYEERSIIDTLTLGWKLLGLLPHSELKRVREDYIIRYGNSDVADTVTDGA